MKKFRLFIQDYHLLTSSFKICFENRLEAEFKQGSGTGIV